MYRVVSSLLLFAAGAACFADAGSHGPVELGTTYNERRVQYEPIPTDCSDDEGSQKSVISAKRAGAKILVDVFMSMNCAAIVTEPKYKTELGHTLSIKTRYEYDAPAACMCRYGLRFTLHEAFAARPPATYATFYTPDRAKIKKGEPIYFVVDDAVTLKTNAP